MTDKINYPRYTKKPWFFQGDKEVLYLYRNFLINERLNDLKSLGYEEDQLDPSSFSLYEEIPRKISFLRLFKYSKAIKNFIIYQQSIKAPKFEEKKILKESKMDLVYIYERLQHMYTMPVSCLIVLFCQSNFFAGGLFCLNMVNIYYDYVGSFLFMLNYNEFLQKFQMGKHFKLGRETQEFVNFINSDKTLKTVYRPREYYEKFFVKDQYEVKFEKEDEFVDYLAPIRGGEDYHQRYLKEMDKSYKFK